MISIRCQQLSAELKGRNMINVYIVSQENVHILPNINRLSKSFHWLIEHVDFWKWTFGNNWRQIMQAECTLLGLYA